jgi:alkyl sulfatase BDS1-like metallo-beta-lactamase superfamily hydrolase
MELEMICQTESNKCFPTQSKHRPSKIAGTILCLVAAITMANPAVAADAEKPKTASEATKAANNALLKELPFSDKTSFELAHKGFIAPLLSAVIKGTSGNVVWDPAKYSFIKEGENAPDTTNPSLWRQSQLINIPGLFEVTDGIYLTGAKELREGVMKLPTPDTASPDTVRAMELDLFFDFLAMRLNGPKAEDKRLSLNFDFTDLKQKYSVEMENGVLNHTEGVAAKDADATVTLTRDTLNKIVLKETSLKDALASGDIKVDGTQGKLEELVSYMDDFDFWFNIVTP